MIEINSDIGKVQLDVYPNKCPFCHNKIIPKPIFGIENKHNMEVIFVCSDMNCGSSFIAYYMQENWRESYNYIYKTSIGYLEKKIINETILKISPEFVNIYNQAFSSEQFGLNEICGVGYRKSLEFLIKDYLISKNIEDSEKIKKETLGGCISKYIENIRVKSVAKRAVWLGNDETHYVRKWETKDLQDLKKLIELTIHWIEMETLTDSLELDMPE